MQRAAKRAAKQFSVKKYGPLCEYWAKIERETTEARDACVINMILCRADIQRQQMETVLWMEDALDKLATYEEIAEAPKTEPFDSCCYSEWKEAVAIATKTKSKLQGVKVKIRRQNSTPNLLSFKKKEKPEFDWEKLSIVKHESEADTKEGAVEDRKELPTFDWEKRRKVSRQKSMPSFLPVVPRASKTDGDYDLEKNGGSRNKGTERKRRSSVRVEKSEAIPVTSSRRLSMPSVLTKQLKASKPLDGSHLVHERVKMIPGHVKVTRRSLHENEEESPLQQKTSRRSRPRRRSSRLSRQNFLPSLSSNAAPEDVPVQKETSDRRTKARRQSSRTKRLSRRKSLSSLAPKDAPLQEKRKRKMRSSNRKAVSRQSSCPSFDWTKKESQRSPVERKLDPVNDSSHSANTSATSGLSDTDSVPITTGKLPNLLRFCNRPGLSDVL